MTKIYLVLILLILVSCKQESQNIQIQKPAVSDSEDFEYFYDRFHADSAFQMSRIKFPLKGFQVDGNIKSQWTKENWSLMKVRIFDVDTTEIKVKFEKKENQFYEKFWLENSGFWGESQFEKINGKWFLTYAAEYNL